MLQRLDISRLHPIVQLLLLVGFVFIGMVFSSLFSLAMGTLIWGGDVIAASVSLSGDLPNDSVMFLKFSQTVVQIGTMLVPPLLFAFFYHGKPFSILNINRIKSFYLFIIALVIPFIILPFIGLLSEWNLAVKFPERLGWLESYFRNMEDTAAAATGVLLKADTIGGLFLNIFVIAIVPAVSEEFLFRGVIQNVFKQWFKNVHWAVIVTGFIFSAIHGQFYGFLPRMAMGIMLGYLFVYSGSIWVPVIAHFINNATVVVVSFLESKEIIETTAEEFGQMNGIWGLISLLFTVATIYLLYRMQKEKRLKSTVD